MADWLAAIPAHLATPPSVGHFAHAEVSDQYFSLVGEFLTES